MKRDHYSMLCLNVRLLPWLLHAISLKEVAVKKTLVSTSQNVEYIDI